MAKAPLFRPYFLRLCSFATCFLTLFVPQFSNAQGSVQGYQHGIMLEGGGLGRYSVNYVKCLFKGYGVQGYARIGASFHENEIAMPVGMVFTLFNGSHHPEITLGCTPRSFGYAFWERDESDIGLDFILGIGYRYEPIGKRWFAAIGAYPAYRVDPTPKSCAFTEATLRAQGGISFNYWIAR